MPALDGKPVDRKSIAPPLTECRCHFCLRRLFDIDANGVVSAICPRCREMSAFEVMAALRKAAS